MVNQKQVKVNSATPRLRLRGIGVVVDNGATTDAQYPDIQAGDYFIAAPVTSQCGVENGDIVISLENNNTFAGADFSVGEGWLIIGYGSEATGLSAFKQALTLLSNTVSTQGTSITSLNSAVASNDTDISTLNAKFPLNETSLGTALKGRLALSGTAVDWSTGAIFYKTLTANTTFTFSGLDNALNKVITLLISGNYTLALPTNVNIISGEYDGTVDNYIQIHCVYVDTETPANNIYWATINQEKT